MGDPESIERMANFKKNGKGDANLLMYAKKILADPKEGFMKPEFVIARSDAAKAASQEKHRLRAWTPAAVPKSLAQFSQTPSKKDRPPVAPKWMKLAGKTVKSEQPT